MNPAEQAIPGLDQRRARRYLKLRLGLMAVGMVSRLAETLWFASDRRAVRLRSRVDKLAPHPALRTPLYFAAVETGSWLVNLPLGYLGGWQVERAYGLTRQSRASWLADRIKGLALGLAIQPALLGALYGLIRRRPRDWWLIAAGGTVPLVVVFGALGPVLIAPRFNRFRPIDDAELTRRIQELGAKAGVNIAAVYQMDMSRQTERANAYFTGFGSTKRIVLGDTLLRSFSPAEIESVVAHELGHQVHADMWRFVVMAGVGGSLAAAGIGLLTPRLIEATAPWTAVEELADPASYPVVSLVGAGIALTLGPVLGYLSRGIERRTDTYALKLTGDPAAFIGAMKRLASQNLSDPQPPRLVTLLLASHPPIAERIAAAEAYSA